MSPLLKTSLIFLTILVKRFVKIPGFSVFLLVGHPSFLNRISVFWSGMVFWLLLQLSTPILSRLSGVIFGIRSILIGLGGVTGTDL